MKLVDLTWMRYCVPFRTAFHTAHGVLSQRDGVLVKVRINDGHVGWGEIAPLPEHGGQHLEASLQKLPGLAHMLQGQELLAALRFLEAQSADGQLPAPLICGLETALLDACGRAAGLRVADLLASATDEQGTRHAPRASLPVNAVIGGATIEAAVSSACAASAAGFTCLKLKLTDASPAVVARVAAVRAAVGSAPRLRLDANGAWDAAQARDLLVRCADYDIEYVEQPLPAHKLADLASLRSVTPIPLALDEALTGLASARRILHARAADILILKPQLIGGLHVSRRIIREAAAQGVSCVITSTLETGIGVAATLHLAAASPEITSPCGLATLDLLENDLLQTSLPIRQGVLEVPADPGLGVYVNLHALARFAVAEQSFPGESE